MIEAEYAARIGISQVFPPADNVLYCETVEKLRTLGIRHLRVPFDVRYLTDPAGNQACAALITALGSVFDVLPSFEITDDLSVATLATILAQCGSAIRAVEICGTAGRLASACEAIHDADCKSVLRVEMADAPVKLREMATANLSDAIDIVGIHDGGDNFRSRRDWTAEIATIRAHVEGFASKPALWITRTGQPTWKADQASQAQAFLDAADAPVERVYWSSIVDLANTRANASHALPDGMFEADGQPKLLARLLASGVAGTERVMMLSRRMRMPALVGTKQILVTGGAGFIGANLVDRLASDGHPVLIYDALARTGVERNLRWLARRHPTRVSFALGDVRDECALTEAARNAETVFHLAGQVAVTTSMIQPIADFEINARGTIALLETLRRHNPRAPLVFASTNKVYGDLADIELERNGESYLPTKTELRRSGVNEQRPLCFHTPYGCSKGAADQYVLDYAHSFGLRTAVLRMSCIYGERQLGTEDQGWVAHFLLKAIAGEGLTIYGDGRQVRDVLHVGDAVAAYLAAWTRIDVIAGRAFNLGGGPGNAISLLQLVGHIEDLLGRRVEITFADWRPGDQRYFVADTAAIRHALSLTQPLGWRVGIARLAEHFGVKNATAEAAQ